MTTSQSPIVMLPEILSAGGRYFNFETPDAAMIEPADIAHALAHICRFGGHCRSFYSVAQHCVLASRIVPPRDAFAALLHDAAEAYVGDIPSPLKRLLPDYKAVERRVEAAIAERFEVALPWPESVKRADLVLLATEQRDLMPAHEDEWAILVGVTPLPDAIAPWPSPVAASMWLARFRELSGCDA